MAFPLPPAVRRSLGELRRAGRRKLGRAVAPAWRRRELARALRTRAEIASFQHRASVTQRFPGPRHARDAPRVVAVVTHVADPERTASETAARLTATADALLESLGHTRLELVLNTLPDRHVVDEIPDHVRSRFDVREHDDVEPLLLGFEAQEEFARRADADWFLYLEEDILVHDGLLLEKLAFFNDASPPDALLLPHRYELWRGRKTYIDLVSKTSPDLCAWNSLTLVEAGGWKFAEFENPHSGIYCLSRVQLERWLATGRSWKGRISLVAGRESAATGCLAEAFRLYKPQPDNLTFLEVRHADTKYSELYDHLHAGRAFAT